MLILLFLMLVLGDVNTYGKGLGWKQRKMRLLLFRMSPNSTRKCIIHTRGENQVLWNVEDLRCFSSSTLKKQHKTTTMKTTFKIDLVWDFFVCVCVKTNFPFALNGIFWKTCLEFNAPLY